MGASMSEPSVTVSLSPSQRAWQRFAPAAGGGRRSGAGAFQVVAGIVVALLAQPHDAEAAERIGIPIAQTPEDRHAVTRKLGAFRTSMLQDVDAGKPVELDALVASVRELGQLTDVATPFTDALLGLSRLHARGLGLYPQP